MKVRFSKIHAPFAGGFGITESLMGVVVMGIVFVALYTALATGFQSVRVARENARATQILLEKFEAVRLYNWEQINTPDFLPPTFTNRYAPSQTSRGIEYIGTLTVSTNMPVSEPYQSDMRMVTVTVQWKSGAHLCNRTFTNFVSKYGLQSYIVK